MMTNPGPVKKRGGKRANSGRKSLSQVELQRLAAAEGKSRDQLLAEVDAGYIKALRIVDVAMPQILMSLTEKALKGNANLQKFLVTIYFKYVGSAPRHADSIHPVVNLQQSLKLVIEEAERHGTITPRIIEGEVKETAFGIVNPSLVKEGRYSVFEDTTEPNSDDNNRGHQPD